MFPGTVGEMDHVEQRTLHDVVGVADTDVVHQNIDPPSSMIARSIIADGPSGVERSTLTWIAPVAARSG
jgi:hypothetical protein